MSFSILQRNYEETIARFALVKEIEKELKTEGTQETFIEEMMTRKEIYEILGYEDYEEIDKKNK
jgi:methylisocitrate lyase